MTDKPFKRIEPWECTNPECFARHIVIFDTFGDACGMFTCDTQTEYDHMYSALLTLCEEGQN